MNLLKRTSVLLLIGALTFSLVTGCSKDDSNNPINTAPPAESYMTVKHDGNSTQVAFGDCAKIDADGQEAIQLNEFITTDIVPAYTDKDEVDWDARSLYSYEILATDGYSPSGVKGYPNNIWDHMSLGHLLTANRQVVFPDEKIDLPGAYNVKDAIEIIVHRKFDITAADTADFFELSDITTTRVNNWDGLEEDAVPLADFVTALIPNPQSYVYNMLSLDQYSPPDDLNWEKFQTGYWLLDSKRTIFTHAEVTSGKYGVRVLEKILVKTAP